MFGHKKKVLSRMQEAFGARELRELKSLHAEFEANAIPLSEFAEKWEAVARALNYPDARQMRPDDRLDLVMGINNEGLILRHADFEDAYEIIQAIDVDAFHRAIDGKVKLETIKDVINAL